MSSLPAGVSLRSNWLPSFVKRDASSIDIAIDHHYESKVYTSGSNVSGHVSILSQSKFTFEKLEIAFTGIAVSEVDMLHLDKVPPTYTFLRLDMPVPLNALPDSRILETGTSYNVPFTFAIPHQLPATTCRYSRDTVIHQEHLRLPSSLGSWVDDDTPQTVRIDYRVAAVVTTKLRDGKTRLIEKSRYIRVLSLAPELQHPITPDNCLYRFTQGRMVQRSRFSPKIGHLRVSATQADPMVLSLDTYQASATSVTVDMEFHAASAENTPPDICAKSANLLAITHYSLSHIGYLPDRTPHPITPCPVPPYRRSTDLVLEQLRPMQWELSPSLCSAESPKEAFAADELGPQRAIAKGGSETYPTSIKGGRVETETGKAYRATLDLRLQLPGTCQKLLVPSFHSCRVSRVYSIHFVLAADAFKTTVGLALPLRVIVQDNISPQSIGPPGYVHLNTEDALDSDQPPPYDDMAS
ncbi:hypothetical protein FDECE_4598 [Fusarium decemcellulare]|nr:hypothetical protein FDECE_4598 [Fusarium decemcellulare]